MEAKSKEFVEKAQRLSDYAFVVGPEKDETIEQPIPVGSRHASVFGTRDASAHGDSVLTNFREYNQ